MLTKVSFNQREKFGLVDDPLTIKAAGDLNDLFDNGDSKI
jgi:hypothetical protein